MSKTKPTRTRPLDRDGDGRDGGSLPGNQTAPMADAADQTDEAETPTEWVRDNEMIELKLFEAGVRDHNEAHAISVEQVTQWPDEDARAAEAFADAMLAEGSHTDDQGDERRADSSPIELPAILAERHVLPGENKATETSSDAPSSSDDTPEVANADPAADAASGEQTADPLDGAPPETRDAIEGRVRPVADDHTHAPRHDEGADADDTFTAEEIAAGQTEVIEAEGEETATAADQAQTLDPGDPVTTLETATAPIAVRLSELAQLTGSKRLYLTASGYSATHSAPFIETATVDGWVAAGLAEFIPSAGNTGGVKATDAARRLERQLRLEQRNAA